MSKHVWVITTAAILLSSAAIAPAARVEPWERGGYRHSDLRAVADDAEKLADSLRSRLDRELDRTIIDGTKKEKQVEKRAEKLENALDDVRSSVRDGKKFNHTRDRVKRALTYAYDLERDLTRLRLGPAVQSDWRQLQGRLNQLAIYFELTPRHAVRPSRSYR